MEGVLGSILRTAQGWNHETGDSNDRASLQAQHHQPSAGIEPATFRLLSECSAPKLRRHVQTAARTDLVNPNASAAIISLGLLSTVSQLAPVVKGLTGSLLGLARAGSNPVVVARNGDQASSSSALTDPAPVV